MAINSLEKSKFLEELGQNATKCSQSKIVLAQWRQRRKAVKMVTLVTKVNVVPITSMATLVPKTVNTYAGPHIIWRPL